MIVLAVEGVAASVVRTEVAIQFNHSMNDSALLERHHKPPAHAKLEPSLPPGEWCFCIRPLGGGPKTLSHKGISIIGHAPD
jgi:hypothetical protein